LRLIWLSGLSFALLFGSSAESGGLGAARPGPHAAPVLFPAPVAAFSRPAQTSQTIETPGNEHGQPSTWPPPPANKKTMNLDELKSEADQLIAMSQALSAQLDQIASGTYPKRAIDNLKKIEKLSKHIRKKIE
jgi:hypothetical protein